MWFLNPAMWWWAAVLAVPIALYLVRHRPQRHRVATLLFFKSLAHEHQESAWLRRLKRLLSLLLTVMVLLAVVAALARPILAPPNNNLRSVVIVMDRSASMAAADGATRTRLDRAVTQAKRRLAGLPIGVPVSLMVYDHRPQILLARSLNRREIRRELDRLRARPIAGQPDPALRLARRLASVEPPAAIWHITDLPLSEQAPSPADDDAAEGPVVALASAPPDASTSEGEAASDARDAPATPGVHLLHLPVASERPTNVGITGFSIRRAPMQVGQFEAFIQVHASGPEAVDAELELRLQGELAGLRKLTLEPGQRQRLLVPIDGRHGEAVHVKVHTPGDALPFDNEAAAWAPPASPVRVLWIAPEPDPFTELALRVLGDRTEVEVFHATPEAYPGDQAADVLVFQNWLPEQWPGDVPAIVIDPPGSIGPVRVSRLPRGELSVQSVRATDRFHPVLYGVATPRVSLTQTAVFDDGAALSGLQPLWQGPTGPALAAGDVRGQRLVVMVFAPHRSEALPLMASYPLLIGNAVYWCTEPQRQVQAGHQHHTGELIQVEGERLTWPSEDPARRASVALRADHWIELDRIGLWQTDAGAHGSASLLAASETVLNPHHSHQQGDLTADRSHWLFAGDLSETLLVLAVGVLLLESYLFHRRAVY